LGSDTLDILGRGPDPDRAARLSRAQIIGPLRRANRRDIDARATRLQEQLRAAQLPQPATVQAAYAAIVATQVRLIAALNARGRSARAGGGRAFWPAPGR
jgi:hypothetical protein